MSRIGNSRPYGREVVFTTGYADERHGDVAGIGASTYFIAKPYSAGSLTRLLRDILEPIDAPSRDLGRPPDFEKETLPEG